MKREKIVDTDEKIILVYGVYGERLNILKEIANLRNFEIKLIDDNHTFCKIEDLIYENTSKCEKELEPIEIEFLLFVNIVDDILYDFNGTLKEKGLYFPNKAILTKHSINWTLRRLLVENKEEHAVMTMFTNLRRAMKKATILKENEKHDFELLQIMEEAREYLNPREFDFDDMKEIYNKLAIKVNELSD